MSSFKLDLHTHSTASPDGGLKTVDYERMLAVGGLDCIAVTDHDTINFALRLQAELGSRIIVGQEIMTTAGEIIGLYLQQAVPKMMTPLAAAAAIRQQGGLVYVPHPFETTRHGLQLAGLALIADSVDIIEAHNGRAIFQDKSQQAYQWAARQGCVTAASSDCHGRAGWGRTYTTVAAMPNHDTLVELLRNATYTTGFPGVRAVMAPKLNRLQTMAGRKRRHG